MTRETYHTPRAVAFGVALGLGGVLLGGCGAFRPDNETIDCLQQPGESIEITMDMTTGGDRGSLAVSGAGKHEDELSFASSSYPCK